MEPGTPQPRQDAPTPVIPIDDVALSRLVRAEVEYREARREAERRAAREVDAYEAKAAASWLRRWWRWVVGVVGALGALGGAGYRAVTWVQDEAVRAAEEQQQRDDQNSAVKANTETVRALQGEVIEVRGEVRRTTQRLDEVEELQRLTIRVLAGDREARKAAEAIAEEEVP